jgi:hypothetical protein
MDEEDEPEPDFSHMHVLFFFPMLIHARRHFHICQGSSLSSMGCVVNVGMCKVTPVSAVSRLSYVGRLLYEQAYFGVWYCGLWALPVY